MTHVMLLNLVFFIPATCGATAFAAFVYRFLKSAPPPLPAAGPDDLAHSA
ncbi:MAG: hypothetical protein WBD48_17650 [Pseudolabrys sp.]